ncbi:RNA polymerase sigma factor [Planctomicrobium sp. SH661]|uniref:RNA polymerase sigma factor n=1 Tax=Planctomicrobium sp. SH661 TaxID=3448124 RepID=UPI003F5C6509
MKQTATGSTAAAMLFMQHYGFVRAMAVRSAPWPGLIDDIFQQVFLEFLQSADRLDLQQDIRPLLATMTRHIAQRHWKQAIRQQPEALQNLANQIRLIADGHEEEIHWDDEFNAIRLCLQRLPAESHQLLDLYYFQQVPTEVIGERLSMKADTVRRALSRLREKLRQCVQHSTKPDIEHA